jgi:hypothetical protein
MWFHLSDYIGVEGVLGNTAGTNQYTVADAYYQRTVSATFGPSAGAPEIDGSLAPKVGFLLGCLFLMFGRKKQNTETMMAA